MSSPHPRRPLRNRSRGARPRGPEQRGRGDRSPPIAAPARLGPHMRLLLPARTSRPQHASDLPCHHRRADEFRSRHHRMRPLRNQRCEPQSFLANDIAAVRAKGRVSGAISCPGAAPTSRAPFTYPRRPWSRQSEPERSRRLSSALRKLPGSHREAHLHPTGHGRSSDAFPSRRHMRYCSHIDACRVSHAQCTCFTSTLFVPTSPTITRPQSRESLTDTAHGERRWRDPSPLSRGSHPAVQDDGQTFAGGVTSSAAAEVFG